MIILIAAALAGATMNQPPQAPGECRWVHGRYNFYIGSSVRRIWVVGTTRIIALRDEDSRYPSAIRDYEEIGIRKGFDGLFGDFYVCARERSRPGHMQHVRMLRTRNLMLDGRPFP